MSIEYSSPKAPGQIHLEHSGGMSWLMSWEQSSGQALNELSEHEGSQMKFEIVGGGFVGSTAADALVMQGIGREIVMVDRDTSRAAAKHDQVAGRNSTSIRNSTDGSRHVRRTEVIGNKR